ncbi:glutaredoxin family protein [Fictibacillus enclensis]|jgi:glutaredoxin|uniref:NrdH-redoxin n=1 Tax=Fictibacillus enclensis TaxID=1017270 RepID=A0A0V8JF16_9BACL|nr:MULTISPECIES: glutaredoxin family protein [Fictibacillus]KSU85546.1 NrdH-redoxin [Fictibacillus enclensis]MDM5199479.1 glutaredoxin family protein [Fictibacillus enclensis]MDM5338716.1 glutaredoxin family protein [Fictibacillus enclensis]RXY98764.1 glutaredoxin family protein [Fictibacillus sp. S7]WHY70214.1 glutaredoxin family protein [Fictibacillus enclensis]
MKQKVIIYTQETCSPCFAEKEWLTSKQIPFEERDIRKNPQYMNEVIDLGASATPVTVIMDGESKNIVLGFKQDELESLLQLG